MMLAVCIALAVLAVPVPVVRRKRPPGAADVSPLPFLEMTALGVSSGLSFAEAAAMAASEVGGEVGAAATRMLRGVGSGEHALERVFAMADRAARSGAPLLPSLDAHIAELQAAHSQGRLVRIRKLQVKLLFPLALLILPGFLLLTVGPVVAGSLQRLGL